MELQVVIMLETFIMYEHSTQSRTGVIVSLHSSNGICIFVIDEDNRIMRPKRHTTTTADMLCGYIYLFNNMCPQSVSYNAAPIRVETKKAKIISDFMTWV